MLACFLQFTPSKMFGFLKNLLGHQGSSLPPVAKPVVLSAPSASKPVTSATPGTQFIRKPALPSSGHSNGNGNGGNGNGNGHSIGQGNGQPATNAGAGRERSDGSCISAIGWFWIRVHAGNHVRRCRSQFSPRMAETSWS